MLSVSVLVADFAYNIKGFVVFPTFVKQRENRKIYHSIADLKARKNRASDFFNNISTLNESIIEFDENLWNILVEKAVVYGKDDISVL